MLTDLYKNKYLLALIALLLVSAGIYTAYSYVATPNLDRKQVMTSYTQSIKSVCVGRYLVDIPASSTKFSYGQEIDGIPITKLEDTVGAATDYERVIKRERAQVDKEILDEKEMGANFIKEVIISPKAVMYIYSLKELLTARQKELYDGLEPRPTMLGYVWVGNRVYKIVTTYNRKSLEMAQSKFISLINSIQPWDGVKQPTTAGVCIDEAFVAGGSFERGELVSFGASIDKDQNTRISFTAQGGNKLATDGVLKPKLGTTLIERSHKADEWVKDTKGVDFKSLRRASRVVLGQPGEEIFNRIEEKGRVELQGKIEITGGGDPKKQYYTFTMNSKDTRIDEKSSVKILIENPIQSDVAITVWDKFVDSLRLRPAAF